MSYTVQYSQIGHFHEGRPDFLQKTAIVEK